MRKEDSQQFPGYMTYQLYISDAFRGLRPASRDILGLLFFEINIAPHNKRGQKYQPTVTNRNDIRLPYAEIEERLGYSQKTIWTAFKEILAHGFLKVIKYGGGRKGDCNIYGLSEKWRNWEPGQIIHEMKTNGKTGWQKQQKK